jgi:hypothetical protein
MLAMIYRWKQVVLTMLVIGWLPIASVTAVILLK